MGSLSRNLLFPLRFLKLRFFLPLLLLPLAGCTGGGGDSGLQNKQTANVTAYASSFSITQGQSVTLEAYVNPTLANGTVTFYNGSTAIGTASLTSGLTTGIAALQTTFNVVGAQSITAHYSGNDFYSASISAPITIGVYNNQLATSSVSLQASTTTPQYQTEVAIIANVAPAAATGTVTFYNGSTNIGMAAVVGGVATLNTAFSAGGTATISAIYSGDYNYHSSTSNLLTLNVNGPLATTTTLSVSPTSTAIGSPVTLTATLSPSAATGLVTFYNGSPALGLLLGGANVSGGVATLNTTFSYPGPVTVTAIFGGSASWGVSTSNQASLYLTGNTPDSLSLQAVPSLVTIGYSSTLTATVSSSTATGTVTFYDGATVLGTGTVIGGVATLTNTFMTAGAQSLTASYSGDTKYLPATSSTVALNVGNPGSTPTTTVLALSEYSGYTGDSVTLTAKVSPASATGQVSFYDNGTLLTGVTVSGGTAAWSQTFTDYSNSITAVYQGDPTYAPSTSGAQSLQLTDAPVTTPPVCPSDPTLCQAECPGDPSCPVSCPSDPNLCQIECPGSISCPAPTSSSCPTDPTLCEAICPGDISCMAHKGVSAKAKSSSTIDLKGGIVLEPAGAKN